MPLVSKFSLYAESINYIVLTLVGYVMIILHLPLEIKFSTQELAYQT